MIAKRFQALAAILKCDVQEVSQLAEAAADVSERLVFLQAEALEVLKELENDLPGLGSIRQCGFSCPRGGYQSYGSFIPNNAGKSDA